MNKMQIAIISIFIITLSCKNSFDVATLLNDGLFTCFAQNGLTHVIVRAY